MVKDESSEENTVMNFLVNIHKTKVKMKNRAS